MELSIHDNNLYGYMMLASEAGNRSYQLVLYTEFIHPPRIEYTDVLFHHVVAHHFEGIQSGNLLFAVEPDSIEQIFDEYEKLFTQFRGEGWPIHYTTPEDLFAQLHARSTQAFRLVASYGGSGWLWAERMEMRPRQTRKLLEP